jgi:hypothetical protein
MASLKVLVNDNIHYMDITEVSKHGVSLDRRQKIVDDDLNSICQPNMTGAALYGSPSRSSSP